MKRGLRRIFSIVLIFALLVSTAPVTTHAAYKDLKKYGASLNWKKGNWTAVYTKLPGGKGLTKFYAKITKYNMTEFPATAGKRTSTATEDSMTTVTMTVQVQYPKKPSKKIAKKLIKSGHDYIDYLDLVVVDKNTGENLNTSETSEEGTNYQGVSVTEKEWKGLKPQQLVWSDGTVYNYYVSYVKTIIIKFPSSYKRTCVGICGNHISSYNQILDWNEGFTEGYTVFSDTTHVKLNNKKTTSQLSHFINLKNNSTTGTNPYGIYK